jgi:ribosomal protein L37E
MKNELISLEDFNNFVSRTAHNTKNGIACPRCGEELDDENPNRMLLCNPPKTEIICFSCGYKGYRAVKT